MKVLGEEERVKRGEMGKQRERGVGGGEVGEGDLGWNMLEKKERKEEEDGGK